VTPAVAPAGTNSDEGGASAPTHKTNTARSSRRGHSARPAGATPVLWHYTCDHHVVQIAALGALIPHAHPFLPGLRPIVWLTTMERPDAVALGLTSEFVTCDRTRHRFEVTNTTSCVSWRSVTEVAPARALPPEIVAMLESHGRPDTWWISPLPVPVVRR